ncbi:ATP-binding cassette domain-containing protein [Cellulomonas dongxiuzhuiae]|uniref:ATP-binding cassette domain-containing protein n=1 Tax=Cellulomonas dongxiuzhuiae TaxID=2819979 RepID=A0ABX8GHG1_9CELL|nr:ATP-binding cassette domain-containing protein [Cellulomonas dongxiuzhuiae]MBO3088664.1 ATP-binding cassette domain-containing protein [Cellulomonas dongxiuzhuiae]MBO3094004.1 ATP-binding cassette domain-containing protein [Cellulomonas dongxiuzhuiae]QWC15076.1 ATP-binding cassette domain-containing protein [Cellulomonas dongxiuzhuiae]
MIRTRGLTKDFVVGRTRTVHAVRGIDLDVGAGELVAVLGPNGAGKTTTMRMLTTLVRPTAGTATVAGADVLADPAAVRRRIGYVGQGNGAGRSQHVVDELVLHGRVHGLSARTARRRADELLDALDLTDLAHRKVQSLSGGQRRRADVALGLVHGPRLLFLDEPSTGLDPQTRAHLWEHVGRLRAEQDVTIVLTTHYLDEADSFAERVVVVDHGRVIADDTADALKRDLAGDRLALAVARTADAAALAQVVGRAAGAREVEVEGPRVTARVADAASAAAQVVRAAVAAGVDVTEVRTQRPTLDDVFLALTGRSLRETATTTEDRADDSAGKDAA